MFSTLDAVGGILQFIGVLTPFVGLLAGFAAASSIRFGSAGFVITYAIAGLVSGAVTYGFGGLIRAQVSIARDARRTANALERLAQRQPAPPPSGRIREIASNR